MVLSHNCGNMLLNVQNSKCTLTPWRLVQSWILTLQKKFFFCFNDSPSKKMNNVFYFILKDLFVLKIFTFLLKFMTSQPGS